VNGREAWEKELTKGEVRKGKRKRKGFYYGYGREPVVVVGMKASIEYRDIIRRREGKGRGRAMREV
jgi:hypothetical protein